MGNMGLVSVGAPCDPQWRWEILCSRTVQGPHFTVPGGRGQPVLPRTFHTLEQVHKQWGWGGEWWHWGGQHGDDGVNWNPMS